MDGITPQWYYALECDVGIITWPRFIEFVNMRFGSPLRFNGLADMKDLRRTGTVEEYQRQFLVLLCRCEGLSQLQQANMFTAGLGEPQRTTTPYHTPLIIRSPNSSN